MNAGGNFLPIFVALLAMAAETGLAGSAPLPAENAIYNPNPNHLWNRLNDSLFIRTGPDGAQFGWDELDPLIWTDTKYLLESPGHQRALAVLDEFLAQHGEKLIREPLKKAWLQHDLWLLFDWANNPNSHDFPRERRDLESRLAQVIRRLALSSVDIASLPDNYTLSAANAELADRAAGLFKEGGPWVILGTTGTNLVAPIHMMAFGGRSVFLVFARFPGGPKEAGEYLKKLNTFAPKWTFESNSSAPGPALLLNKDTPQFPTNTDWALVRQMCVIDDMGRFRPTHLVESIQMRHYYSLAPDMGLFNGDQDAPRTQRMSEFKMNRRLHGLLAGVGNDDRDFLTVHFFSKGIDPFQWKGQGQGEDAIARNRGLILRDCFVCHSGPGVHSLATVSMRSAPPQGIELNSDGSVAREFAATTLWKQSQPDWKALGELWNRAP